MGAYVFDMIQDLRKIRRKGEIHPYMSRKYGYYYEVRKSAILSTWLKMNGYMSPYEYFSYIRKVGGMHSIIEEMDLDRIKEICEETKEVDPGQNQYRWGRLTASQVGKYLNCQKQVCPNDPLNYLTTMYDEKFGTKKCKENKNSYLNKCLDYGITMENTAKNAFVTSMTRASKSFKLYKQGFYVDPYVGIFGCTPDGKLVFEDGTEALLEIKCPYVVRSYSTIKNVCQHPLLRKTFELMYDEDTQTYCMNLNSFKGRKYNDQIQLSMWVTGITRTYFCVYLPTDVKYILVEKDDGWAERNIPNLCRLYRDFYMDKMGREVCQINIANQKAFDEFAEKGVPLEEWPERVWCVRRAKPKAPPDYSKKRRQKEKVADRIRDEHQKKMRKNRDYHMIKTNQKRHGVVFIDE